MKPAPILSAIRQILNYDNLWFTDKLTKGYKIKLPYFTATDLQIKQIMSLSPSIRKCKNYKAYGSCHYGNYTYPAFVIYFDCKPSEIQCIN